MCGRLRQTRASSHVVEFARERQHPHGLRGHGQDRAGHHSRPHQEAEAQARADLRERRQQAVRAPPQGEAPRLSSKPQLNNNASLFRFVSSNLRVVSEVQDKLRGGQLGSG